MKEPKLLSILKTLKKDEWTDLEKHILANHKKQSDNYQIFQILQKQIVKAPEELQLDRIKKKHFSKMTDKGFSNMLSRLTKIAEEWLVSFDLSQSVYQKDIQLIRSYNHRGLYKLATKVYHKLEKKLSEASLLDLETNKMLAQLYHSQYYSDNPIKYQEGGILLEKLVMSHLNAFAEQSLFYQIEMVNWGKIKNYNYEELLAIKQSIIELLHLTEIGTSAKELLFSIQNNDIQFLESIASKLFEGNFEPDSELHTLIGSYCLNFSLEFWRKGIITNPNLISKLYEYCLETGILLQNGKIPRVRFFNIIGNLGTLKSYEYMSEFIDRWISFVYTNHIESVYALANAENCFIHQQYHKILPIVRGVTFEDIDSRSRAMCFICTAIFKDKNLDEGILLNEVNNCKRYLKRHKEDLPINAFEGRWNFLTILLLLTKRRYKSLKIDLQTYENLHYRTWIKSQL